MTQVITLTASSDFGQSGQYIAKLTGRAPKVQFRREFCGTKSGKRNDLTSYETDEIGLYEIEDRTRKGKVRTFWFILPWGEELRKLKTDHEDALLISKRLDAGERLEDIVELDREPMTRSETQSYCTVCDTVVDGCHCPNHPDAAIGARSIDVPALNEDGSPKYRLVYSIRKPGEVKKAIAAATLDTAVDAIVQALAALPASEQKKALTLARARMFPKAEPESGDGQSAAVAVN